MKFYAAFHLPAYLNSVAGALHALAAAGSGSALRQPGAYSPKGLTTASSGPRLSVPLVLLTL